MDSNRSSAVVPSMAQTAALRIVLRLGADRLHDVDLMNIKSC